MDDRGLTIKRVVRVWEGDAEPTEITLVKTSKTVWAAVATTWENVSRFREGQQTMPPPSGVMLPITEATDLVDAQDLVYSTRTPKPLFGRFLRFLRP